MTRTKTLFNVKASTSEPLVSPWIQEIRLGLYEGVKQYLMALAPPPLIILPFSFISSHLLWQDTISCSLLQYQRTTMKFMSDFTFIALSVFIFSEFILHYLYSYIAHAFQWVQLCLGVLWKHPHQLHFTKVLCASIYFNVLRILDGMWWPNSPRISMESTYSQSHGWNRSHLMTYLGSSSKSDDVGMYLTRSYSLVT